MNKDRDENNNRVVRGGKAFTEMSAPLGKKEVELGRDRRVHLVEAIDVQIAELKKRKASLEAQIVDDARVLQAIDSGGDFGG